MKIQKDFKNDLLGRREIEGFMEHTENPGKEGAKKAVVDFLKVDGNLVVIKRVVGNFGSNVFYVEAYVYDNEDAMKKVEPKPKEKKK
ncbi:hypothetical protein COU62_02945 [Candidatus Pacearchaeota archaeon CG10_big_fil_rev_8_21_14_0_10_35_219]|nr:hypothetical protein [Candidatus Pacearchaeota archaeon]OIO42616.1 MAG: hypothetical protein AUJ63_02400 [Candidatus Pacearchaeota archaeon CG1_02_35_32]PIO07586.1 MAG: hypothetical protein COU62_02945 [Candidatus Pacearchaeota archaeon CG10_big_fil_rev_8_21_14_0_10_35_219]PIY81922.1 MAG: hypothetical protein COY79_00105 [Candidatus Pacearchaeota archaeon CG_4_10_14_0_8_um_filter_35_169]PIZ80575.1 MAG: hypothetical protein COY00_00920 [Candidatus Pacearchaeota archaeon CG_4_10_14_0_2_um_filt